MLETFIYLSISCRQSEAIMLRIINNEDLPNRAKVELVETFKESTPHCKWEAWDAKAD